MSVPSALPLPFLALARSRSRALKIRWLPADKSLGARPSMKILYVSHDRRDAERAARALNGLAPDVALTWARSLGSGLHWVDRNVDAAAVIVEAALDPQGCRGFVEQVRSRGLLSPVVFVVGSQQEQSATALPAPADGYVVKGDSVDADLCRLVADLMRERSREQAGGEVAAASARLAGVEARHSALLAREARISTALQQRLLELEAAPRSSAVRSASEPLAPPRFEPHR